jgi:hypothetical protein
MASMKSNRSAPTPEHRHRLGLAGIVCTAVLHAFADAGGHRATVYCRGDAAYPIPKQLYESMGFTPTPDPHLHHKDISHAIGQRFAALLRLTDIPQSSSPTRS